MAGSGLYVVRSDAGDTGPRPDQDHRAGMLPDPYLLCSKTVEDSLLQRLYWRRVAVLQSATMGRLHVMDAPRTAPGAQDANPASGTRLGKGLIYFPGQM